MQTSHRCRITSEDFGQEKRYINIPPSPISLQKILKMNYISSFWDIHNSCRKSFCQSESFPNYPKHIECFFFWEKPNYRKILPSSRWKGSSGWRLFCRWCFMLWEDYLFGLWGFPKAIHLNVAVALVYVGLSPLQTSWHLFLPNKIIIGFLSS